MSPDSPVPSVQRKAWRAMSAVGCVLGATGILLNAVGGQRADVQAARTHEVAVLTAQLRDSQQQIRALTLQTSHDARVTTAALCTLRSGLEQQVDDSERFLRKHPRGIPGIPVKDIRTSIANRQRTITALSGITCPR